MSVGSALLVPHVVEPQVERPDSFGRFATEIDGTLHNLEQLALLRGVGALTAVAALVQLLPGCVQRQGAFRCC